MLKWLLVIALIFGGAVFVSRQDKRAAQKSAEETAHHNGQAITAPTNGEYSQKDIENAERYGPSWYSFFRWPSGTATLLVILTLLALVEQTGETKKAASAALLNAQALIHIERPWIMVKVVRDKDGSDSVGAFRNEFNFMIKNYGKSPAHITNCSELTFDIVKNPDTDLPVPPKYQNREWQKKFLGPTERWDIGRLPDSNKTKAVTRLRRKEETEQLPEGDLIVYGMLEYSDGVSTKTYKTAFCYRHLQKGLPGGQLEPCGPPIYNEYT